MELFKASRQWSERPSDERFDSLQALYDATKAYADVAVERSANVAELRTEAIDGDVQLMGRQGVPAKLTHWSFGQLSARVGAPASYLRELPATLAVQNLNHGLKEYGNKADTAQLMFHSNGGLLLRAFTSEKYSRIWNWEVAQRLLDLESKGWRPAKPTTHWGADTVGTCIMCSGSGVGIDRTSCKYCKGTGREYPALYASDHDMFAFIMMETAAIAQPVKSSLGDSHPLYRGVIVENSEVGASALKLTRFWFNSMCGNHIIWGASKVMEISVRHVGDARYRWGAYQYELRKYAESSASDDAAVISAARTKVIGDTKEQVLDRLFGMRSVGLSRKVLEAGYDAALPVQDGSPNTVWGMVQGLTRHSQTIPYADGRTTIDRAAGKLMEGTF